MKSSDSRSAEEVHALAEKTREEDKLLEAFPLYDEAITKYQKNKDYRGILEALLGKFLTYKHLFLTSKDDIFLVLGKAQITTALQIAEKYDFQDKLSVIYFSLGEENIFEKEYKSAVECYEKALHYYKDNNAMRGDYTYHLGEALYRNGEKEKGEQKLREGLELIQKHAGEVDSFVAHVWESGCYLRMADLLYADKPQDAKEYLDKGGAIIEKDDRLVIRKRQYEELKNDLRRRQIERYNKENIL